MELTSAVLGGKKGDDGIGLDNGEGMDELTDEQITTMKAVLGEADFSKMYPDYL
ncbi:hypothetical protein [Geobacter sp. SVR]|uniref:hypothetical protein n=1 Tax=Geobacter sp. SVR TaxID=2495594 RepID=UPI00143EF7D3|nr:hypothetical protein [Geobacter sp. SVR]BCS54038.1 hypothetical protein GSVR_23460 [Geobacter sp. SVR]GCF86181.1 hypothetical protein GSbR_27810 [Geobacter sp. SVR]